MLPPEMATLHHPASTQTHRLLAEHTVGRSGSCILQLDDRRASGHHASLRWNGADWEVLDLGSRNGTWVDGVRLEAGQRQLLARGATIGFGSTEDPWTLTDVDAPNLVARTPDGDFLHAEDGLLSLPHSSLPTILVYADSTGQWVAERNATVEPVQTGTRLTIGPSTWELVVPSPTAQTTVLPSPRPLTLSELTFVFDVSRDEENVQLRLLDRGRQVFDEPHRAHFYLLLALARARLEDAALPANEQGWRYQDDLAKGLQIPHEQFNVTVFRTRQYFGRLGLAGAKEILERRRGSGQVRLGPHDVTIERR